MQAVNYGMKGMAANVKLAEAMGETTKTMGQMNKVMDPMKIAKTMNDFEQANVKMGMTEETSKLRLASFWEWCAFYLGVGF